MFGRKAEKKPEATSHPLRRLKSKSWKTTDVSKDVEKPEPSDATGGTVKWPSYSGKHSDSSSNGSTQSHHATQQFHSKVHAQEKWKRVPTRKPVRSVHSSAVHCHWKVETAQLVQPWMNEKTKWGVSMQWSIIRP